MSWISHIDRNQRIQIFGMYGREKKCVEQTGRRLLMIGKGKLLTATPMFLMMIP